MRRATSPLRSLVTIPYLLEGKTKGTAPTKRPKLPPEVAVALLRRTLHNLRRALDQLAPSPRVSRWSHYTTTASHYSAADNEQKAAFVERALAEARPRSLLDVGGNTGHYSRIAVAAGASVVALDTDVQATAKNWQTANAKKEPILPLIADIARPTPAVGWRNRESRGLLDRSTGAFDTVLMLGVIHHLLLVDQVPLPAIFDLVRQLTTRWALIEWVPATDSQFVQLCRGRQELYGHLDEKQFLATAEAHFQISDHARLPNGRSLWLFERHTPPEASAP